MLQNQSNLRAFPGGGNPALLVHPYEGIEQRLRLTSGTNEFPALLKISTQGDTHART